MREHRFQMLPLIQLSSLCSSGLVRPAYWQVTRVSPTSTMHLESDSVRGREAHVTLRPQRLRSRILQPTSQEAHEDETDKRKP
ncbi:hypothetical protein C8Q72DRAFT_134146 [Fomitopsis betulina]|nr:hypothetical protein C8Q72DRAFT_134146 [Fomitopsis betulina]